MPNLIDSLVLTVDQLRGLFTDFGLRQYRVYLVKRLWTGGEVGAGTVSEVSRVEITPAPAVDFTTVSPFSMSAPPPRGGPPVGRQDNSGARLSDVSLTYTEADLTGVPLAPGEEFFYQIEDSQAQGVTVSYWVPSVTPWPDRTKTLGWVVDLKVYEVIPGEGA